MRPTTCPRCRRHPRAATAGDASRRRVGLDREPTPSGDVRLSDGYAVQLPASQAMAARESGERLYRHHECEVAGT